MSPGPAHFHGSRIFQPSIWSPEQREWSYGPPYNSDELSLTHGSPTLAGSQHHGSAPGSTSPGHGLATTTASTPAAEPSDPPAWKALAPRPPLGHHGTPSAEAYAPAVAQMGTQKPSSWVLGAYDAHGPRPWTAHRYYETSLPLDSPERPQVSHVGPAEPRTTATSLCISTIFSAIDTSCHSDEPSQTQSQVSPALEMRPVHLPAPNTQPDMTPQQGYRLPPMRTLFP